MNYKKVLTKEKISIKNKKGGHMKRTKRTRIVKKGESLSKAKTSKVKKPKIKVEAPTKVTVETPKIEPEIPNVKIESPKIDSEPKYEFKKVWSGSKWIYRKVRID